VEPRYCCGAPRARRRPRRADDDKSDEDPDAEPDAEPDGFLQKQLDSSALREEDYEMKRRKRLELNRKAAQESRRRKKIRVDELQRSVVHLTRENSELHEQNEMLRQILGSELPVESRTTIDRFQTENAALKLALYESVQSLTKRHQQQHHMAPAQQQQQQQQHQQHHAHHMALEDAAQDAASRDNGKAGMAVRRPNGHSQPGLPPHHGSQNPSMQNPSMHGQMGNPNMMGMLHSGHAGAGLPQQRHGDVQGQQHLMQQGLANEAFARAQQARALPGAPSDAATLSAARSRRPAKAYQN